MKRICMFCGHRDICLDADEIKNIKKILNDLIKNENVNTFYTGGMGNFDKICSGIVRELKKVYKHIRLYLIIPYLTKKVLRENMEDCVYDEIIEPDLGDVYYKCAIVKRNQWMVEKSEYIVAYVYKKYGGAYTTLKYGNKLGRKVINIKNIQ